MKHKAAVIVPVVVVAVVVAVIAIVVSQDAGGADAFTVDGTSVSQATVNGELAGWASSGLANSSDGTSVQTSNGAVTSDFAALWLTNRIEAVAIQHVLDDHDLTLTASDLHAQERQLPTRFADVPQSARDALLVVVAGSTKLNQELGETRAQRAFVRAMRRLDVSVDPKYGRWVRARVEVCAWTGCPASTSSGTG